MELPTIIAKQSQCPQIFIFSSNQEFLSRNPKLAPAGSLALHTREAAVSRVQGYICRRQLLREQRRIKHTENLFLRTFPTLLVHPVTKKSGGNCCLVLKIPRWPRSTPSTTESTSSKKLGVLPMHCKSCVRERSVMRNAPGNRLVKLHQRNCARLDGKPFRFGTLSCITRLMKTPRCLIFDSNNRSKEGVNWAAWSPFQNNELLMIQVKLWARADLEHLTVQKCADWINATLFLDWTTEQLKSQLFIKSFLVKPTIVRRRMRDAGFKYKAYCKC
jgi:hypothetical protein